jgi:hypothetical protein
VATKDTNAKDAVGVKKWRQFCTLPFPPLWEVGVAMLEGARKYGRHNYRAAGVRASVYVDAAMGHISQWWEGEDLDPDSGLSHITKAIATLVVMRDAMLNDMFTDDRPPKSKLSAIRDDLQAKVEDIIKRYPDAKEPFLATEKMLDMDKVAVACDKLASKDLDFKDLAVGDLFYWDNGSNCACVKVSEQTYWYEEGEVPIGVMWEKETKVRRYNGLLES